MFKLVLEKAEEPEIKWKKQEGSRKMSISALLAMPKPLTVWKILKEMGIPDRLTCLLRNLYAGQEAAVDVFRELSCFFSDPVDVGNLISGSSCLF